MCLPHDRNSDLLHTGHQSLACPARAVDLSEATVKPAIPESHPEVFVVPGLQAGGGDLPAVLQAAGFLQGGREE